MEEILTLLPRAWTGEPLIHHGDIYDFPEIGVRPRPSVKIPILVGGGAEAAIRRAARLADGIFANAPRARFLEQVGWIKDECDKIGRNASELRIIHYSVMLPAESQQAAMERYSSHVWQMMWKYDDMEDSAFRRLPPNEAPPFDESKRNSLFGRSVLAGTGEEIVESLLEIRQASGMRVEFAARSYFHTLGQDAQVELMERLAKEVSPHI